MANSAELVREYLEQVWNQGRTDLMDKFVSEDLIQHNPHLPNGREPLRAFIDGFRTNLPQAHFQLARIAADGDLVFAHQHFTSGPGNPESIVVDIFRVEDGVLVEHWDVNQAVNLVP